MKVSFKEPKSLKFDQRHKPANEEAEQAQQDKSKIIIAPLSNAED